MKKRPAAAAADPAGGVYLYALRDPIWSEVRHVGISIAAPDASLLEQLAGADAAHRANARWIERLAGRGLKPSVQEIAGPLPRAAAEGRMPQIVSRYRAIGTGPVTSDLDEPEPDAERAPRA